VKPLLRTFVRCLALWETSSEMRSSSLPKDIY
jgi:hypothetical protein